MNDRQRVVIVAAAAVIAAMLIYPPFRFVVSGGVEHNMGYGWIFDPPKTGGGRPGNVNMPLLLAQWGAVVLVAGALFFVLHGREQTKPAAPVPATATKPQLEFPPIEPMKAVERRSSRVRTAMRGIGLRILRAVTVIVAAYQLGVLADAFRKISVDGTFILIKLALFIVLAATAFGLSRLINPELRVRPPMQLVAENAGAVIFGLRILRGLVAIAAAWQLVGLFPALGWEGKDVTAGIAAVFVIKLGLFAIFAGVFFGLRWVIHQVHKHRTGAPHPQLAGMWAL